MIASTQNKGFQLTFANGITISVQFGEFNYCQNRYKELKSNIIKSRDAEIAIWDIDNKQYKFSKDDGNIKGWVNADEVARWIERCSKAKDINSI